MARSGTITITRAEYSRLVLESEALHMLKRVLGAFEARENEPNAPWATQARSNGNMHDDASSSSTSASQTPATITTDRSRRGIYIPAIPAGTTLQELVSVIKGGAIISLHFVDMKRESKTTTKGYLTLKSGAKEFLEWTQLNPIFLHGKKINFIWSNDKPTNKPAVDQAVEAGATRNIIIHGLGKKGITLAMLREDIGNLPTHGINVISSFIRGDDAYLSNNSVWSAMRLREAVLTHYNYIGCTASYFADECERPLDSKPDILPPRNEITECLPLLDMDGDHNRTASLHPALSSGAALLHPGSTGSRQVCTDAHDNGVRIAMSRRPAAYATADRQW